MARLHVLRTVLAGAAAVLLLIAAPAHAQWKWKDKAGHVQYSDLPPPTGTPEQDILQRPGARRPAAAAVAPAASGAASAAAPAAASGALTPKVVEPELEAKRRKAEADLLAKNKAQEEKIAAARADNCSRARSQLRMLDSGVRIARVNEKGEREILDDKQRADDTKLAKEAIASDCR